MAVGETLRRLAARAVLLQERARLKEAVSPHQQAIGQKGACELVVKALRLLAVLHPDVTITTLDMRNAYNSLSRAAALEAIIDRTPWLVPMTVLFYSSPSSYVYCQGPNVALVHSALGVEQGDVEAPALFALALAPALAAAQSDLDALSLAESLPPVTILAYLDDVVIAAHPLLVERSIAIVSSHLASFGLNIQPRKTKIWTPSGLPPPPVPATFLVSHRAHDSWRPGGSRGFFPPGVWP